ncbi:hypothetical protein MON38_07210 [Hymenobacter sp. DH14]|uniref:Outer membrane protein beta-barrel domain-containing protein n=1 Tax=Hymenobacter cyanobacteriorum TaxID=2926463 RepID=A0A9X1VHV4_9BACT|nr:hypothetical protein [Hymenobacter cyanobacteriorum]MCI1187205.1 hypothetical protein [Hymenobacter cyanobacteriorum]
MPRLPFHRRHLAAVATLLPALLAPTFVRAQAVGAEPATIETTRSFEVRGGYTGGRFSHSTDDFHSSISLFGGSGSSRTGFPVEHRYDGLMLGGDYVLAQHRPDRPSITTLRVGLDVLGAADRLRIGDGRRATVALLAAHPHFSFELQRHKWQTRVGVGMLVGRVGYYGQDQGFDLLATNTVVDTVNVVPTFSLEMNWNHWVQYEAGYGANGLLGLANPTYYGGLGTGFGPRSPLALVVGVSSAASLAYNQAVSSFAYSRLTLAPAGRPWQASAFATFGSAQYQRVALQVGYKLPQKGAPGAPR